MAMGCFSSSSSSSCSSLLRFIFLSLALWFAFISRASHDRSSLKGVDIENPVLDVTPLPYHGQTFDLASREALFCERVRVSGRSRLHLGSYANSFQVAVAPSLVIPEKLHGRIQVCFHMNASLGLCDCGKDEWRTFHKGLWQSVMSPYEERYLDVKFIGELPGSVAISVSEDPQAWRLFCLAMGFALLMLAPIVSSWVPFYYSTSMAIGVFLVILIILFQGMKLLPTGRKNLFYLSIYGSVLGAGTYILHHISMLVNSILVNFGLSEEMHNPVYVFVLVGIVLTGAALGYWIVRKYVILKDGTVDAGVAQFVKWAMRFIATTFIFQSTLDTPLAMVALAASAFVCFRVTKWFDHMDGVYSVGGSPSQKSARQATIKQNRAEFLSRSAKVSPAGKMSSPKSSSAWTNSPVKGLISPAGRSGVIDRRDYYSTFHKTPKRKKFTKRDWDEFTRESTQQALAEWAASPEVANWMIENADRIQLLPSDCSSEEIVGSETDSTDEAVVESSKWSSLFNW